ncbi:MAG: DNA mismatch repair protein MutS, partial [Kiritimatiellae bacterium]|nr:DNA mismatch repair protein MutS [Kiritimatiellia bacterium]
MVDTSTPMMRQYRRIKGEISSDIILFFRLGDFYEMFFEDAKAAAPILDIALTKRHDVPMCGVPVHALDGYLAKLIRAGKKVAICDQVEEASASKGIVRREVTRVVTPGTVIEDSVLESGRNNFLAAICRSGDIFGLVLLDLSTGLFEAEETCDVSTLAASIRKALPMECIVPLGMTDDPVFREVVDGLSSMHISACEDWTFDYDTARDNLIRHFGVHSLDGFGCEGKKEIVRAAGAALYYVREDLRRQVDHIKSFHVCSATDFLIMDESTCANLDLIKQQGWSVGADLLGVLDVTKTAMGRRKLRDCLLRPLTDIKCIVDRHDVVETFYKDRSMLGGVSAELDGIRDLERLIVRIGSGGVNGRDLVAVGRSLSCLPTLKALVGNGEARLMKDLARRIALLPDLVELLTRAIVDEPPVTIREGGVIRDGYDQELDELQKIAAKGRRWLAEYQATEQERTGIKTLKVRHNRVFGYYIEVSKAQMGNVPDEYIRKQTLVNAERFITPELKDYENRILGSRERSIALEYEIFQSLRDTVLLETGRIQETAKAIAEIDVLVAFADRALALGYVRPTMTSGDRVKIREGRHPVVEQMPDSERFVPNDTNLDCTENQLIIITGPNMAGKSTYIRQVAVLVIMAQMGSFVPADEAEISVVDRVFTRVGASDDLARGRSTFMVEMQETANILNNATPRSLIVLDEIGRGTSTYDGISIAWSITEFLHNHPAFRAKVLFATHYHELNDMMLTMKRIKNFHISIKEHGNK